MGRKLAGIFGIAAATLAFGIGTAVEAGQSNDSRSIQQVVADDKGPTVIGTQGTDDDKGPTVIGTHVLADDKGPTVVGTLGTDDDKGPTSPVM
ncbi:hypothetical protein GCM10015535_62120 [Streptomyces gelaticus]|uniref:DUF320 domain-containing protein n=1 Tax=Streptomyces gelaticus TaxID=285446 RepID=A0ABQ2WA50_9ACTN|nr:hypothetical protein [Streptomyces gelaticus]GGV95203.1 hypothetical protein GCM10015535_62120 [Streptomyces gelaticus]